MIRSLPVLAYHFGVSPSDVWGMTIGEYDAFIRAVERINRENS